MKRSLPRGQRLETPQEEVTVAREIRRLIEEAGRVPVRRNTLYHRVERDAGTWTTREHIDACPRASYGLGRRSGTETIRSPLTA